MSTFRLAHVTDVHVQPELDAEAGFAACLRHLQSQVVTPSLVLTGGDMVMDTLEASAGRADVLWDSFHRVMKAELSLPVEHVIGNHDVIGWARDVGRTTAVEGKQRAMDELGLATRYRSVSCGTWKAVLLDSTHVTEQPGYTAKLDEEQFAWLESELADTQPTTPVMVVSHIPILSAAAFLDGDNVRDGDWQVPGAWMHVDVKRIVALFRRHTNVKLCLSGHLHLVDQVLYDGVTYCCCGAACAAWWKGDYEGCTYGYTLVDLHDDGRFEVTYTPYGWPRP